MQLSFWLYHENVNTKHRKFANIQVSLHFCGMIILVKTKPLCMGMAWLPFQKQVLVGKTRKLVSLGSAP